VESTACLYPLAWTSMPSTRGHEPNAAVDR
jgi:hypothetical protein